MAGGVAGGTEPADPARDSVLVLVLSSVLGQLVSRNDRLPLDQSQVTRFHALKPPTITIQAYLERILKYAPCSRECFVVSLIYMDRILQRNRSFVVTSLNIHRLLITSVMLAAKFFDDFYYNNAYYAKVGGVPCPEMNLLELEFLFMINFTLNVPRAEFERYRTELMKRLAPVPSPSLSPQGLGAAASPLYQSSGNSVPSSPCVNTTRNSPAVSVPDVMSSQAHAAAAAAVAAFGQGSSPLAMNMSVAMPAVGSIAPAPSPHHHGYNPVHHTLPGVPAQQQQQQQPPHHVMRQSGYAGVPCIQPAAPAVAAASATVNGYGVVPCSVPPPVAPRIPVQPCMAEPEAPLAQLRRILLDVLAEEVAMKQVAKPVAQSILLRAHDLVHEAELRGESRGLSLIHQILQVLRKEHSILSPSIAQRASAMVVDSGYGSVAGIHGIASSAGPVSSSQQDDLFPARHPLPRA